MWLVMSGNIFFFFQAEDGIRDYKVTGVQTCALPICIRWIPHHARGAASRGCSPRHADTTGAIVEPSLRILPFAAGTSGIAAWDRRGEVPRYGRPTRLGRRSATDPK